MNFKKGIKFAKRRDILWHFMCKAGMVARQFLWTFILLGLATLLIQILELLIFSLPGKIIDSIQNNGEHTDMLAAVFIITVFFRLLLNWTQWRENIRRIYYPLKLSIALESLSKIFDLPLNQIAKQNRVRRQMIEKGEKAIEASIDKIFFSFLPLIFRLKITVIRLCMINYVVALDLMIGIVLFIGVSYVINQRINTALKKIDQDENNIASRFWETAENAMLVVMRGKQKSETARYVDDFKSYETEGKKIWIRYMFTTTVFRDILISGVTLSVILLRSIRLTEEKAISPGDFVTIMILSLVAFTSMNAIGSLQRDMVQLWTHIKGYFNFLRQRKVRVTELGSAPVVTSGDIIFDNVQCLASEKIVKIGDVSWRLKIGFLCVKKGQTIHIVGPSGSGKSTLINVLLGVHRPATGRVLIGGYDISKIDRKALFGEIGFVSQSPKFYNRSLKENLIFGLSEEEQRNITDEELIQVLNTVCLPPLVGRLYETIGENGDRLSGGERQRLAIGMAIITKPSIIIYDEATNSLDPLNEALVLMAMVNAARDKTCFVITHKLATLLSAQDILVLNNGVVAGQGTHDELRRKCPIYASMIKQERLVSMIPDQPA